MNESQDLSRPKSNWDLTESRLPEKALSSQSSYEIAMPSNYRVESMIVTTDNLPISYSTNTKGRLTNNRPISLHGILDELQEAPTSRIPNSANESQKYSTISPNITEISKSAQVLSRDDQRFLTNIPSNDDRFPQSMTRSRDDNFSQRVASSRRWYTKDEPRSGGPVKLKYPLSDTEDLVALTIITPDNREITHAYSIKEPMSTLFSHASDDLRVRDDNVKLVLDNNILNNSGSIQSNNIYHCAVIYLNQ